jgi:N-acetylmuramoyl-L-alanine amidase
VRRLAAATAAALTVGGLAAPAASQAAVRYTVRPGDTLSGIAARSGISMPTLARANGLDPQRVLMAGAVIRIPSPVVRYTVRWGDTLSGIAARTGTSVGALARRNGLDPDGVLLAGATLRVSGRSATAPSGAYVVRRGDTLSGIAARFGTTVSALAAASGLNPFGVLLTGSRLTLPSAGAVAGAAAAAVSQPWSVGTAIDRWSVHYGVDARLARALAWMESGWQQDAVSSAGAVGIMQLTPATWRYAETVLIGAPVAHDADGNIRVGVAYLHHLLHEFGWDERRAVAAYYQGASAVHRHGILPVSQSYVADVLALRERM